MYRDTSSVDYAPPELTHACSRNSGMITDVQVAGNTLDEVQSFKYLCTIIREVGSKPKVLARIAQPTAALSSLKIV